MKTIIFSLMALGCVAVVATFAFSESPSTSPTNVQGGNAVQSHRSDNRIKDSQLKQKEKLIRDRLGVAAHIDVADAVDPTTGYDPVIELYEDGFIIPASIEEVEAALNAAAQTPEIEDDQAARRLKNRGSFRFFLDQSRVSGSIDD